MAQAMENKSGSDLNFLTDCMYFINGRCKLDNNCRFRHCHEAAEQINNCARWPKKCRNVTCPYRHPTKAYKTDKKKPLIPDVLLNHPSQPQPPAVRREGFISFFWDIENVPIPKGQKPFDIVQRVRQKLVVEPALQEADFSCYCNSNTISPENQQSLHHAAVRIVHVPDRKSNAVDRQIMLDLDRFERIHRPPATVVLISGDIDFVGKLSDLRHQAKFYVIVIHNKPAKEELKITVNEHYPWELFTQQQQPINVPKGFDLIRTNPILQTPQQQPINVPTGFDLIRTNQILQTPQQNQIPVPSSTSYIRRRDPSRNRRDPSRNRRDPSRNRRDPSQNGQFILNRQEAAPYVQEVQIHRCPKCINEFESIQALRQHQNAKDHLFHCPVCNENFITKVGQTQHQRDKNHYILHYKCNQCNRSFTKADSLKQHQQATGHISSPMQPTLVPFGSHNSGRKDQDPMDIILNGIEAIKEHFAKQLPKK